MKSPAAHLGDMGPVAAARPRGVHAGTLLAGWRRSTGPRPSTELRPEDIGLAEAVGASAIYLGGGDYQRPGVWSFPSLAAAAPFILERVAV